MARGVVHSPDFVCHVFRLQKEQKSNRNVAQALGKGQNAICNVLRRYDSKTGKTLNPGKGKPRCTTIEQNALVVGYLQANRFDFTVRGRGGSGLAFGYNLATFA